MQFQGADLACNVAMSRRPSSNPSFSIRYDPMRLAGNGALKQQRHKHCLLLALTWHPPTVEQCCEAGMPMKHWAGEGRVAVDETREVIMCRGWVRESCFRFQAPVDEG